MCRSTVYQCVSCNQTHPGPFEKCLNYDTPACPGAETNVVPSTLTKCMRPECPTHPVFGSTPSSNVPIPFAHARNKISPDQEWDLKSCTATIQVCSRCQMRCSGPIELCDDAHNCAGTVVIAVDTDFGGPAPCEFCLVADLVDRRGSFGKFYKSKKEYQRTKEARGFGAVHPAGRKGN